MPGTPWTQAELDTLRSNYRWNPRVKAMLAPRSSQAIRYKAMKLGLKKHGRGNIDTLKATYFDRWSPSMAYILGFFIPNKPRQLQKVAVPKKFFSHFLRGYFDGNGGFSFSTEPRRHTPRLSFTGGSRNFLAWLEARIVRYYGLPHGRLRGRSNQVWTLVYRKSTSLALMEIMYEDFTSSLYLPRKLATFCKYLNYHGMDSSAYETPKSEPMGAQIRYSPRTYRIYRQEAVISHTFRNDLHDVR